MSDDLVYVLPLAVLRMLNYQLPNTEAATSYDDHIVYSRENALKLSRLLLSKWQLPPDEVNAFFKDRGPSNEVLGDLLATKLLLRPLVGQERHGEYFKAPHKQFDGRSLWQQIQVGADASGRVREYLMGCIGR
ncbi:hypothetical protein [Zhongshania sp.]|jgi:hypothetical protein|uniref:hypothetical protein n=1 Tax=Zhongshania sp. TaxID=1971902 RepID=UPI002A817F5D|nr:hypothetical protein [Zhongshania sp.]